MEQSIFFPNYLNKHENVFLFRKTTLLNCILGLTRLDSGYISVMGRTPGTKSVNIGHMPQVFDTSVGSHIKNVI